MKVCKVCGEGKPLTDFYRAAGTQDGHRGECKSCNLAAKRARSDSGLLCINCNQGIGKFAEDPERLARAAAYLRGR